MTGRRDARDDRPPRERRSKAGNAARLAEMADLSADAAEERRHYLAAVAAGARLGELLDECAAERARLAAVVDLCVLEFETRAPSPRWGSAERAEVFKAHNAAMAEEVERRG